MAKNLEISVLLDYYGQMLTEKQREVARLYYNEDLSLAEIAQFANITRQGVRDSIKRAETTLLELEERLGLVRKFREYQGMIEEITACARDIAFEADSAGGSLKTAVAAADMVEYLAGDFVPQDLAGETTATTSGKIMGGYSTCLNLGQFSISLISVPLFAAVGSSYPVMFGVMAAVAIVACVAFVVMSRTGVSGGHGAGA